MAEKILLIRLSAMGDVIFALPVLDRLRRIYPGASLTWLVEDKAASLLLHRNDLREVLVYPRKAIQKAARNPLRWGALIFILVRHLRALRRTRYDLIFDFQGNLKSGVHLLLARGEKKVGYAKGHSKEMNHLFSNVRITPPPHARHRIEKSMSLVDQEVRKEEIQRPDLQIPRDLLDEASGLKGDAPLMVVHPGTSVFGAYKRWAPEKFGMLARRLGQERGFETLVTWGPDEGALAEGVVRTGGDGVRLAPPTRSLIHLAAIIRQGDVYVSADSGPLHLANYMGVPSLALFGPKEPALYRPYFPPSRVVRSDVDCAPCPRRQCDDPICMKNLKVEAVYEALTALLDEAVP